MKVKDGFLTLIVSTESEKNRLLSCIEKINKIYKLLGYKFNIDIVTMLVKKYNRRVKFSPGMEPYITLMLEGKNDKEKLKEIEEFLMSNNVGEKL